MSLRITACRASSVAGHSKGNKQISASEPSGSHCKNSTALLLFFHFLVTATKHETQDILQTVRQLSSPKSTSIASAGAFFEATLSANRNSFQSRSRIIIFIGYRTPCYRSSSYIAFCKTFHLEYMLHLY